MATIKVEALSYTCDDPGCGRTSTVTGEEMPPGYELTVTVRKGGERVGAPVYACRVTHVRPAVEAVIDEQADGPGGDGAGEESDPRDFADDGDANQVGEHQLAANGRAFDTDPVAP